MATGFEPLVIGAMLGGGGAAAAGAGAPLIAGAAILGGLGLESLSLSREQGKLERAAIEANRQEAKLAAAEKALNNAQGFRKALANQLALANFRGGPGSSIASQFGAESMGSFLADQRAIERGSQGIDTAASISRSNSILGRSARDIGIVTNFATLGMSGANLSKGK